MFIWNGITDKRFIFNCLLSNNYVCEGIFWENVGDDKDYVLSVIDNAESVDELVSLMNEYV